MKIIKSWAWLFLTFGLVIGLTHLAEAAPSASEKIIWEKAMDLVKAKQFSQAELVAVKTEDSSLIALVRWLHYASPKPVADFVEIASFIDTHPNWPFQITLQIRAEEAIGSHTSQWAM